MQPVTKQYKEIMRAPVREAKVHATVYFGMFDHTASEDATLAWSDETDFSQPGNLNAKAAITTSYAAFEPDQMRLDGAQSLLPSNAAARSTQGFVSTAISGAGGVFSPAPYIDIQFAVPHSMVGLSLNFDPAYDTPGQFTVLSYSGSTLIDEQPVTGEIAPYFTQEFLLEDIDRLVIRFDKTKKPGGRARLNRVRFGIGYTYSDQDLIVLTESHVGSPLSMTLPTSSLTFTLFNEDGRFDVDSDTALQRFLANGQRGVVDYGVDVGGAVETVPGGIWTLESWRVNGTSAVFKLEDALAQLNKTTYEISAYDGEKRTLAALAEDVFADAGLAPAQYYIDPALSDVKTRAPLPIKTHAACLQLIANAGRCRLYVDRGGVVVLERLIADVAHTATSSTPQTPYSDAGTVLQDANALYATFEQSFMRLDGVQVLVPSSGAYMDAGWTASAVSGQGGQVGANELVLTYSDPTSVFNVEIDWGACPPPAEARLSCRIDGVWKNATLIRPAETVEGYPVFFQHCNAVKLEVLALPEAGQRARVQKITASLMSDFVLSKDQIFDNPNGALEPKLRDVVAEWTLFGAEDDESDIASVEVELNSGWVRVAHELCLSPAIVVEPLTGGPALPGDIVIDEQHYAYASYVRLTSATEQTVKVLLTGRKVTEAAHMVTAFANSTGEDLTINNPLLSSESLAQEVADWTRDYYAGRVVYESNIRGFPELDNFDTVYMWDGGAATINSSELTYTGAFNQKLKLRRR